MGFGRLILKLESAPVKLNFYASQELLGKKIKELDASKNDYITHKEYESHAYKCLSNKGTLLVFTKGV